jgi:sortase A
VVVRRPKMFSQRLVPALASVGLGCGLLFTAPLAREFFSSSAAGGGQAAPVAVARAPMAQGELVARLSVSRLSLDSPVFEGVEAGTLARGAGHVPGTALPGEEEGNKPSVIAIARGSNGAAVAGLRLGDRVRLTTGLGGKRYRVIERRVLEAAQFRLASAPGARITLIAPYPSDYPGPAPLRIAVALEQQPD